MKLVSIDDYGDSVRDQYYLWTWPLYSGGREGNNDDNKQRISRGCLVQPHPVTYVGCIFWYNVAKSRWHTQSGAYHRGSLVPASRDTPSNVQSWRTKCLTNLSNLFRTIWFVPFFPCLLWWLISCCRQMEREHHAWHRSCWKIILCWAILLTRKVLSSTLRLQLMLVGHCERSITKSRWQRRF